MNMQRNLKEIIAGTETVIQIAVFSNDSNVHEVYRQERKIESAESGTERNGVLFTNNPIPLTMCYTFRIVNRKIKGQK